MRKTRGVQGTEKSSLKGLTERVLFEGCGYTLFYIIIQPSLPSYVHLNLHVTSACLSTVIAKLVEFGEEGWRRGGETGGEVGVLSHRILTNCVNPNFTAHTIKQPTSCIHSCLSRKRITELRQQSKYFMIYFVLSNKNIPKKFKVTAL